jgi:endonuclease/exonuclease/phosphatase family metal-dependent hydrolase
MDPFEGLAMTGEDLTNFTVLSANVGNTAPWCWQYIVKLCRKDVEDRVAENLQVLRPDLVALQETLPPWMCEEARFAFPGSVCAGSPTEHQARRLLGSDYTIVCDSRNGFECIAVHTGAGEILGVEKGAFAETDRIEGTDAHPKGCRGSVSIMAATVRIKGHVFDVVNGHAENRDPDCRLASIRQIFEGNDRADSLVREQDVLIMGDFNLDPWQEDDSSSRYWRQHVGLERASSFVYHSGPAECQPPRPTMRYPFLARTYDHVASNFLSGVTRVLGESPGTTRLDGGRGTDHRALYGQLSFVT